MRFYIIEVIADSEESAMEAVARNEEDSEWSVSHADLIDPQFDLYAVTIEHIGSDYVC